MSILQTTHSDRVDGSFTVVFSELSGYNCESGDFTSSGVAEAAGHLWSVRIYPGGILSAHTGCLFCYLVNESPSGCNASFSLTLREDSGTEYAPLRPVGSKRFTEAGSPNCMHGFQQHSRPSGNNLTVLVSLSVYGPQVHRALDSVPQHVSTECDKRGVDLSLLLSTGQMSDFTITAHHTRGSISRTKEVENWMEISVHRLILSVRSPVLKAMLESGLTESVTGQLRITDVSAAAVQEFVRFLYSGNCNAALHAEQLLTLAHRYEVPDLQRLCEHSLQTNLSVSNVLPVLALAELYGSATLRKGVFAYIVRNAAVVLKSRTFLPSLSPELCQEVLCAMAGVERSAALPLSPGQQSDSSLLH
jgi:hypothetical protein